MQANAQHEQGWFDCGVNLIDERLEPASVLVQSRTANVKYLCVIATDLQHAQHAVNLCEQYPESLVCTAGVHPHYADGFTAQSAEQIRQLVASPHVVAIGECGLDFNRNFSSPDNQRQAFEVQLELACELQKPVLLHERDAFDEQYRMLSGVISSLPGGVAHCFTGDTGQMTAYLELGLYIGITGWLCDEKRGLALREAVHKLPLERLILETDAPYLWPKTLRPRKRNNHPANIPHIAEQLSALTGHSVMDIQQHSWRNSLTLLGKPGWGINETA
ncbi:TatD family hydrolase [Aestuariibacter salexigens]|uniref:TatD family hydrolase n=1 Tax=Aestuariibacter salexigens TaxID=226010 RepID=UPI0004195622|nr:TatD family hydrolase [Aestuariibacter salexigens]